MKLTLKIWRQKNRKEKGKFVTYAVDNVDPEMSMLECLDVLNESLIERGEEPVAFEHDCREGICGSCGFMINGVAHGPERATTVCQLTMRHFKDGDELVIEPWRALAFPLIKDLVVDRLAFDTLLRPAATSRFRPVTRPMAIRCWWQGNGRSSDGRCLLHWLRRLRGGLPKCFCSAVYGSKNCAPRDSSPGRSGA